MRGEIYAGGRDVPRCARRKKIKRLLNVREVSAQFHNTIACTALPFAAHSITANNITSYVCESAICPIQFGTAEEQGYHVVNAPRVRVTMVQRLIYPPATYPTVGFLGEHLSL
jgi:hypothetical protein